MVVTKFRIVSDKINDKFRIIQLSDLHKKTFGKNNIILIEKIQKIKPDFIFITGDMVSRSVTDLTDFKHFVSELLKIAPVYYSIGNHEKDIKRLNPSVYKEIMDFLKKNVFLLDNSTQVITINNTCINVTGITIYQDCYKKNGRYRNLRVLKSNDISDLIGEKKPGFNILLAHNPVFFDAYAEYGSDLILSGHVHGGCIRLPFIGGLLSPERKFFPKYSSGIYTNKKSSMIVSRGLGKFRLFNPPEIILIELS